MNNETHLEMNIECLAAGISELKKQLTANGEAEDFIEKMCNSYVQGWLASLLLIGKR